MRCGCWRSRHGSDSGPPDIATRRQLAGSRFRGNDGRVITGGGMRPNRQNEMIYLMFFLQIIGNNDRYCQKFVFLQTNKTTIERMVQNDEIIQHFMPMGLFKTSDIAAWFRESEPDLKDSSINWRVYVLVKDGVLSRVSKGVFKIGESRSYNPVVDAKLKKLAKTVGKQFPFAEFCLWDTALINNFSQHLTAQGFYVVAVEKDAAESVFHFLLEKMKNVYYNPTDDVIDNYLYLSDTKSVVVKNMVSEAPTETVEGVKVPSLEMILVDLFCDKRLFKAYQGNELAHIYRNIFSQYSVNMTKVVRYAARRGKKPEIEEFIKSLEL